MTLTQRTNYIGFPKAGELIEITGAYALGASDRAIANLLLQHAHDSGRLGDKDAEWEISIAALRPSSHESNDRVRDSLERLMRVIVHIPLPDSKTGEPRITLTPLFEFFDLSVDEKKPSATVRYGIPKKLRPVLVASRRWGRIKAEVVCSMTSKYSMALYELVQLRAGMEKCIEQFTMERFRDLLGVPPGKLERGPDFERRVIAPALLEVNGLSEMSVRIDIQRSNKRSPAYGVTLVWWRKEEEELRAVIVERNRSKAGRMERLKAI